MIINVLELVIDDSVLEKYNEYYFSIHTKARKIPIPKPYHESINAWMIMKRPMMNALKQRWKDFIKWWITDLGYNNLRIEKCEIEQSVYFATSLRHDIDNTVPKFILDGFVESGLIVDDDCKHIQKLTLMCDVDKSHPRTVLKITDLEIERKEM